MNPVVRPTDPGATKLVVVEATYWFNWKIIQASHVFHHPGRPVDREADRAGIGPEGSDRVRARSPFRRARRFFPDPGLRTARSRPPCESLRKRLAGRRSAAHANAVRELSAAARRSHLGPASPADGGPARARGEGDARQRAVPEAFSALRVPTGFMGCRPPSNRHRQGSPARARGPVEGWNLDYRISDLPLIGFSAGRMDGVLRSNPVM